MLLLVLLLQRYPRVAWGGNSSLPPISRPDIRIRQRRDLFQKEKNDEEQETDKI